jgi:hypothetical protein
LDAYDQPDDQGDYPSNKGKRQQNDEKSPADSRQGGDIASDARLRLTSNHSRDGRHIACDVRRALKTEISEHHGHVASHLRPLFDDYIPVNGGYVSGHFPTHKYGAVYASEVARLLSWVDKDVMVELDAVGAFLGQGRSS